MAHRSHRRVEEGETGWPGLPLIGAFVRTFREERGRTHSARTAYRYGRDLEGFAAWLTLGDETIDVAERERRLATAGTPEIRRYIIELGEHNRADSSRIRILAALSAFYDVERSEGRREDNPTWRVQRPKLSKRLPRPLKAATVTKLLATSVPRPSGSSWMALRDQATIELLYGSGIRRAELVGLDVGNVDLDARQIRVVGKGAKERVCLITTAAAAAMRAYEAVRPKAALGEEAYFLGHRGRRLSVRHLNRLFSAIVATAGVDEHATPHQMRHSVATDLYDGGMDLFALAEQLGHENLQTTRNYARVSILRRRLQFDSSHPREVTER